MTQKLLSIRLIVALLIIHAAPLVAQTDESGEVKIRKLETTIEQLTLQLAKTVEERNRLRKALLDKLTAQEIYMSEAFGCDLLAANEYIQNHPYREGIALGLWLEANGRAGICTQDQLKYLKATYSVRVGDIAHKIIEQEVSSRR